jgi:hypothetical protein
MEVHRPHDHSPFRSWKDLVVEISTIVIGVLIALSFEGAREWNRNRTLVREAKGAIVRELTENKKAVTGDLSHVDEREKQLDEAQQFADEILKNGKTSMHSISLRVGLGDLSSASWQTADHTGALAHMTYGDVQKYAAVYSLQDLYQAQERRSLEHLADALSMLSSTSNPEQAPRGDVDRFRTEVLTMKGDVYMESQLAKELSDRYTKVLKE